MDQLEPQLRLLLTADILDATQAARTFSARQQASSLGEFAECFTAAIRPLDTSDTRPVLISAEDLSGILPGRRGVAGYDAAGPLMNVACAVLRSHFGERADITVWFTTRTARDWQQSVYWQNLRALRLTEEFETYRVKLQHAARLPEIVNAVTHRLGHRAKVLSTPIEASGSDPLGPLGVALDLLKVSREGLDPLPAHNVQPEGAAEELLALNRSDLDDDALIEAKRRLIRRMRKAD